MNSSCSTLDNASPYGHLFLRCEQPAPYPGFMPPRKKKKPSTFDEYMGRVIESKRVKAELTVEELAAASGVGYSTLRRRLDGAGFTVLELERVAHAVNTPAHLLVEEALADFGGMGKLLNTDPVSDDAANVTPADNVTYLGHVKAPLKSAADDDPRTGPKDD